MTTHSSPLTWANISGDVGLSYGFSQMVLMHLQDNADLQRAGVVGLVGDLAGSGTDTMRVRDVDGYGYSTRLQSMATETSSPVTVNPVTGYTELVLGQHGLASSESFKSAVLSPAEVREMLGDVAFARQVGNTLAATIRYNACVAGAGITASVGGGAATDLDDYLDAIASFNTQAGAAARGAPVSTLHLQQIESIVASARTDPAFQNSAQVFGALMGVRQQYLENFLALGGNVVGTDDVQTTAGVYQGFMTSPGAIGWGRAAMSGALANRLVNPVFLDELGTVIFQALDGHSMQVTKSVMIAFLGFALGSSNVFPQTRILGTV